MWWFFNSLQKLAWLPSSISSSMLSSKSIYIAWCIDLEAKKNKLLPTKRFIHSFPRTKLVHKAREFLCFHFAVVVKFMFLLILPFAQSRAWDQEISSLCGLRFKPCDCSYDGHWRLIWSLTSGPMRLVEVRASWPGHPR